jgi:hypothetical protein
VSAAPTSLTRRSTSGFSVPFSFDAAALIGGATYDYGQWAASPHAYEIFTSDFGLAAYVDPRLFADPCHPSRGFAKTGSTPAELAAALRTIPGLKAGAAHVATLDGYSGVAVDLQSTSHGAGCEKRAHLSVLETDPSVDEIYDLAGQGGEYGCCTLQNRPAPAGGSIKSHWLILDVHGSRLVLEGWTAAFPNGTSIGGLPYLERALESITFE